MPRCMGKGPPWLHAQLRGHGYRCTMPREAVLEVLRGTLDHLSAEEIYLAVHRRLPNIGLTTVYRTLDLLVRMGVVVKFEFGDGRARFELAGHPQGKGHHHHLVCTVCGKVVDYTDFIDEEVDLLEKTEKGLSKKYDFEIRDHLIQFQGVCGSCRGGAAT